MNNKTQIKAFASTLIAGGFSEAATKKATKRYSDGLSARRARVDNYKKEFVEAGKK